MIDQNQNKNQYPNEVKRSWYQKTSNYYLEFCIMFFLLCVLAITIPVAIYSSLHAVSGDSSSWRGALWSGSILLPMAFVFTPLYLRTREDEAYDYEKHKNVMRLVFVIMFSVITIITALIMISNSIYSLGYAIKDSSVNRFLSNSLPAFLSSLSLAFMTFAIAKKPKPGSTIVISLMLFVLIFSLGIFSTITGVTSGKIEPEVKECGKYYTYNTEEARCVYDYDKSYQTTD